MPGILSRLFGRKEPESPVQAEPTQKTCPHAALTPRWDDPADMGIEEKASAFYCAACDTTFPPEEGRRLRESEAERLRQSAVETCPHKELAPRWNDSANDGDEAQASSFVCTVCSKEFSPAEAQTIRATAAE